MKKMFAFVAAILLVCMLAVPSLAASLELSLEAKDTRAGELTTVAVYASENSQLFTTEFVITYDPSRLEYVENSVSVGRAAVEASPYLNAAVQGEGKLKVVYTSTTALKNGGEIVLLKFKARRSAAGEQSLGLETEHAETFDGKNISKLEFSSKGCTLNIVKAESSALLWVAVAVAVAAAAAIAIVIVKHRRK